MEKQEPIEPSPAAKQVMVDCEYMSSVAEIAYKHCVPKLLEAMIATGYYTAEYTYEEGQ